MTLEYWTLRENRTHFNANAVAQSWHCPRDFYRLVQAIGPENEITAHRFFRFRKGSVDYKPPIGPGDHPALATERLRALDLAAFIQSLEPRHHFIHGLLQLVCGKPFVPMRPSEEQHVFTCRYFCIHIFVSHNLSFSFNRPTNEGASLGQLFRVFVRLRRRLGAIWL